MALGWAIISTRQHPDNKIAPAINAAEAQELVLWEARQGRVEVVSETVNTTEVYNGECLGNFIAELKDFQQAIEENPDPVASGLDGLRVVQVTLGVIESARDGRTVNIEPATA